MKPDVEPGLAALNPIPRGWGTWFTVAIAIQALILLPLAGSYPKTDIPLLVGVGVTVLPTALILQLATPGAHWMLQVLSLSCTAAGLFAATVPAWVEPLWARALVICTCCALLPAAAWTRFPNQATRWSLIAQQTGLCVTLLGWLVVDPLRHTQEFNELFSRSHFHHGMRVFLIAPLLCASTLSAAILLTNKARSMVLASLFAGQYGIGCIELGVAVESPAITYAGIALDLSMIPLLFVARHLEKVASAAGN